MRTARWTRRLAISSERYAPGLLPATSTASAIPLNREFAKLVRATVGVWLVIAIRMDSMVEGVLPEWLIARHTSLQPRLWAAACWVSTSAGYDTGRPMVVSR